MAEKTNKHRCERWQLLEHVICRPKMCYRVERQMYYHLHTGWRGIIKQRLPKYSAIFKHFLFAQLKINQSHVQFSSYVLHMRPWRHKREGTWKKSRHTHKRTYTPRETAIGYSRAKDWLIFSVCGLRGEQWRQISDWLDRQTQTERQRRTDTVSPILIFD